MRLSELLSEETITISLSHDDKNGVIEELLDVAMKSGQIKDRAVALKAVLDREALMSTGLERGVAVPHAKTNAVENITMALGVSADGIDFESADGGKSHIFFFLLAPESAAAANVQVLAQIARLTSDVEFTKEMKAAETPAEALKTIKDLEI